MRSFAPSNFQLHKKFWCSFIKKGKHVQDHLEISDALRQSTSPPAREVNREVKKGVGIILGNMLQILFYEVPYVLISKALLGPFFTLRSVGKFSLLFLPLGQSSRVDPVLQHFSYQLPTFSLVQTHHRYFALLVWNNQLQWKAKSTFYLSRQ